VRLGRRTGALNPLALQVGWMSLPENFPALASRTVIEVRPIVAFGSRNVMRRWLRARTDRRSSRARINAFRSASRGARTSSAALT